jgi:hypothetical protein
LTTGAVTGITSSAGIVNIMCYIACVNSIAKEFLFKKEMMEKRRAFYVHTMLITQLQSWLELLGFVLRVARFAS